MKTGRGFGVKKDIVMKKKKRFGFAYAGMACHIRVLRRKIGSFASTLDASFLRGVHVLTFTKFETCSLFVQFVSCDFIYFSV